MGFILGMGGGGVPFRGTEGEEIKCTSLARQRFFALGILYRRMVICLVFYLLTFCLFSPRTCKNAVRDAGSPLPRSHGCCLQRHVITATATALSPPPSSTPPLYTAVPAALHAPGDRLHHTTIHAVVVVAASAWLFQLSVCFLCFNIVRCY